jgi:thiamine biosynthesis lipoprotein
LFRKALVTSGSYQRYFDLDGVRYHHIIDPDTGYPHIEFASVSVMDTDSGYADCLSTALFSMSLSEGKAFVEKLPDVEVLWIMNDGSREHTKDFFKYALEQ